jgi:hypothetical protein
MLYMVVFIYCSACYDCYIVMLKFPSQLYTNVEFSADSFATFWQEVAKRLVYEKEFFIT